MRLKKGTIWIIGFGTVAAALVVSLALQRDGMASQALDALVWVIGLGLGAQVGDSAQRSAFYRPELDKEAR